MKDFIIPPFLKPGDTIGLIAPARWIDDARLIQAEAIIRSFGFKTLRGQSVDKRNFQYSGTDDERLSDFQSMLDNPEVCAIMAVRGGYGTIRILDSLDFSGFVKHPKWLCGFSDFTMVHSRVNVVLNIASLHCAMPVTFPDNSKLSIIELFEALSGNLTVKTYSVSPGKSGQAEGQILGGNLSILQSLLGSPDQLPNYPFILIAEDVGEYLYHIERLFFSLKRTGKLKFCKAFIAGGFTDLRDNTKAFGQLTDNPFGRTHNEIIRDFMSDLDIPYCLDFPFGHVDDNRPVMLGRKVRLEMGAGEMRMEYIH